MTSVLFLFGCFLAVATIILIAVTGIALAVDPPAITGAFLVAICLNGFVAGVLIFAFRGRERRLVRAQSYALALLIWLVGPVFLALPYAPALGEDGWFPAYADAVAMLTTSGGRIFSPGVQIPAALHLWRGAVAWLGGAMTLALVITILAPSKVGGLMIGTSHAPEHRSATQWGEVTGIFYRLGPLYALTTLLIAAVLMLTAVPPVDALILAMGALSTTGVEGRAGEITAYGNAVTEWVLIVGMLAGGTGLIWATAARRTRSRLLSTHWESGVALLVGAVLALAASIALHQGAAGAAGLSVSEALREGVFVSVSLITTTGYEVRDQSFSVFPFPLVLSVAFVGGVTLSTAGGIKVYRAVAMLVQSGRELNRLIYPHSLLAMQIAGQGYDMQGMKAIWSTYAAYAVAVAMMSIALAVSAATYPDALLAAISAIATFLPLYDSLATGAELAALPVPAKLVIIAGMILGRIEILAIVTLLNWRLVRA